MNLRLFEDERDEKHHDEAVEASDTIRPSAPTLANFIADELSRDLPPVRAGSEEEPLEIEGHSAGEILAHRLARADREPGHLWLQVGRDDECERHQRDRRFEVPLGPIHGCFSPADQPRAELLGDYGR